MVLEQEVKISEVSEFRFCPIPKIENSEILEGFLLLQILKGNITYIQKRQKIY